jgi:hypothetical protein
MEALRRWPATINGVAYLKRQAMVTLTHPGGRAAAPSVKVSRRKTATDARWGYTGTSGCPRRPEPSGPAQSQPGGVPRAWRTGRGVAHSSGCAGHQQQNRAGRHQSKIQPDISHTFHALAACWDNETCERPLISFKEDRPDRRPRVQVPSLAPSFQ